MIQLLGDSRRSQSSKFQRCGKDQANYEFFYLLCRTIAFYNAQHATLARPAEGVTFGVTIDNVHADFKDSWMHISTLL